MSNRSFLAVVLIVAAASGCAARGPGVLRGHTAFTAAVPGPAAADGQSLRAADSDPWAGPTVYVQAAPAAPRASRARRIATGALIGFTTGAAVGLAPWVREACLNAPRWHCAAKGGAVGAGIGIAIAAKK